MPRIIATALFVTLSLTNSGSASEQDKPACEKLKDVYLEIAKRSGEAISESQAHAAVYNGAPTNEDCKIALTLFPAVE